MSEETVSGPGTGTEAQIIQEKLRKLHLRRSLFNHPATTHLHQPRNINVVFEAEKAAGNFNKKVAVGLTSVFQAMPTFWLIMTWIVLWIAALHRPQ